MVYKINIYQNNKFLSDTSFSSTMYTYDQVKKHADDLIKFFTNRTYIIGKVNYDTPKFI